MKFGLRLLLVFGSFGFSVAAELKPGPGYLIKRTLGRQGACEIVAVQADYVLIRLPGYTTDAGLALVPACDVVSQRELDAIQASRGAG